jgi:hypothetical protein
MQVKIGKNTHITISNQIEITASKNIHIHADKKRDMMEYI